ncbi:threonine/homoserine efflux transporter RhtA [Mucilaginibacter frigoritolerans]|uniref:Threonine/homoserine efflux transporter RhtA n=1 Tax=Mucilaginibacter frigoritolerans TaxID=652788 RepID=A0A562UC89_9SPHI|nr:DMT family transporter [Mucilaginibacter frigoritolerans]TWJ03446.1 threonine/homoserine efflux transporter RhtA [Mucilaginibacter frigoritolerans]
MNPKVSLAIGILCISFSPIFVKLAGVPPITSGFYRIFIAWVCLAPYCIVKGNLKIGRKELIIAIVGGVVFGSDIAVWNLSLMKISATVSTLLANLAPVWVGLIGYLLFKKRSGKLFWIGTFVAIAGMVILVGYQNIIALKFNIGILLALLASFLYAVYILITKGVLQKISTLSFMFYNMLAASIYLLLICAVQQNNVINFTLPTWLNFLGMGIVCQLVGWITINHSLRFLESTKVSIALLGQTVIAGFWAILFLNERLELKEIIGSVIVLAGIAITFLRSRNQSSNGKLI